MKLTWRLLLFAFLACAKVRSAKAIDSTAPPFQRIETERYAIQDRFWSPRIKQLVVSYVPFIMDDIENDKSDWKIFARFKALDERHAGKDVSNPFVHNWAENTVYNSFESMCWTLLVDPQGDPEMIAAQKKIHAGIERWIPVILGAQDPDGYLCTDVQMRGFPHFISPKVGSVRPGEDIPPELAEDHHEGYLMGYFIECAIAHYQATGGKDLRMYRAAKRGADLFCRMIGDPPKLPWQPDHEELEQALARFSILVNKVEGKGTGNKYVQFAQWLLNHRGVTPPHLDVYRQKDKPLSEQTEPYGHAVMFGYLYSGVADVARLSGDKVLASTADRIWERLVNGKMYLTGAMGNDNEVFQNSYILPNDALLGESCASCANLFFQQNMNLLHGDAKYVDVAEMILYNGILGSVALDEPKWQYFNPLDQSQSGRPTGRVNQGIDCCMGNISRTLLRLPTWIYSESERGVVINQFIGSTVILHGVAGTDIEMTQQTDYPWDGKVIITVNPTVAQSFAIRIRVPNRQPTLLYAVTPEANGIGEIRLNHCQIEPPIANGYAVIERVWQKGDRIELRLPLKIQRVKADSRVAADAGRVALQYGPLIYNFESIDLPAGQKIADLALARDAQLNAVWDGMLLGGVVTIRGTFADGTPLQAIPNFARMNRLPDLKAQTTINQPARSVVWIREPGSTINAAAQKPTN